MATRCISSLNDLDKISNRIFKKHSRSRFRAGIEAKLKSAREKTEACLKDLECEKEKVSFTTLRNTSRTSAVSDKRNLQYSGLNARAAKEDKFYTNKNLEQRPKPIEDNIYNKKRSRRDQRKYSIKTLPETSSRAEHGDVDGGKCTDVIPRSMSMYSRHNGSVMDINTCSWFNFKPGSDAGKIDSFACDAMNKKPLCYTVNIREAKSVPKLLRHRMQVRIGTNGLVKMEDSDREESQEGYENVSVVEKVRTAPLSWDEQLNWNEACVRTPRSLQNSSSCGKGVCETRPVIFNNALEPRHEPRSFRLESSTRAPAFRFYREPRRVTVDPGSYTNSEKSVSITCVGVEDARDSREEDVTTLESKEENIISCRRSDSEDADKLDLSRFDIAKMYSPANDTRIDSGKPINQLTKRPSSLEKLVKKVSFVDEKEKSISNKELTAKENFDKDNSPTFTEKRLLKSESKDPTSISNLENKVTSVKKKRPQTSTGIRREKPEAVPSLTICDNDNMKWSRPRRPYTAPPSSPRVVRDKEEIELFEKWLASVKNRQVIKIPTSTIENGALSKTPENEREPIIKKTSVESMESEETFQHPSRISVSFGSKSAPPRRSPETPTQVRCSSSQQRFYTPPSPVVVCSESSAELPKNLPPAQALIALRKKIRDELAQQNHELQLDIQQLYLRKHPS